MKSVGRHTFYANMHIINISIMCKYADRANSTSFYYYSGFFSLVFFRIIVQWSYFQLSCLLSFFMEVKDSMYMCVYLG